MDAKDDAERAALNRRYQAALAASTARGADALLKDFEAGAAESKAVLARSVGEVLKLANSERDLFGTYHQLRKAGLRLPAGDEWDYRRSVADAALFLGFEEHITFAALSMDGVGLSNYGECSIMLRSEMIAHRASVFEENSVVFVEHRRVAQKRGKLPHGYRASWSDRGKLCAAKLHSLIDSDTTRDGYSGLLMREATNAEEDQFVEVHIFGPWTARSIEQVSLSKARKHANNVSIRWLARELGKFGVAVRSR